MESFRFAWTNLYEINFVYFYKRTPAATTTTALPIFVVCFFHSEI
jgi:hypothetical protein